MSMGTCPRCGATFDPRRHEFQQLEAMPGRLPGYRWCHRRPDTGKECYYDDAGALPGYTEHTAGAILTIITERDVPDEARMAG